jgi:hypothetical protein
MPACCSATTPIEVVEVLPWVPAMSTARLSAISSARTSDRRSSGIPAPRAATSSGLSCGIAANEVTTASGSPPSGEDEVTFSAR